MTPKQPKSRRKKEKFPVTAPKTGKFRAPLPPAGAARAGKRAGREDDDEDGDIADFREIDPPPGFSHAYGNPRSGYRGA